MLPDGLAVAMFASSAAIGRCRSKARDSIREILCPLDVAGRRLLRRWRIPPCRNLRRILPKDTSRRRPAAAITYAPDVLKSATANSSHPRLGRHARHQHPMHRARIHAPAHVRVMGNSASGRGEVPQNLFIPMGQAFGTRSANPTGSTPEPRPTSPRDPQPFRQLLLVRRCRRPHPSDRWRCAQGCSNQKDAHSWRSQGRPASYRRYARRCDALLKQFSACSPAIREKARRHGR